MQTSNVIPVLVYEDIEAAVEHLVRVFGFTAGGVQRLGDGTVVHGEVAHGDQVIWLHRVAPDQEMRSPRDTNGSHGGLSVHVPDLDEHFERSKAAGAHIDAEPVDAPYGLREYGARDLEGHRWWFFRPVA